MKHNCLRLLAIATLLTCCGAVPAQAAFVSYNFAGTITTASDPLADFGISSGDSFAGSFTYDTSLSVFSSGPGNVLYEQPPPIAPAAILVTINGTQYTAANLSAPLSLQVTNNAGGLQDQFVYHTVFAGSLVHPLSGIYPFSNLAVSLHDSTGTVFNSTAIPSSLDLNDFDLVGFSLGLSKELGEPGSEALFLGTITSLTSVPEPSSLVIMFVLMLMVSAVQLLRFALRKSWLFKGE